MARPPAGYYFTLDSSGRVPTYLNGTQVHINGKPAPLLYTSFSQINAIVPYEIEGRAQPLYKPYVLSQVWSTPVAPAAPVIFTLDPECRSGMTRSASVVLSW